MGIQPYVVPTLLIHHGDSVLQVHTTAPTRLPAFPVEVGPNNRNGPNREFPSFSALAQHCLNSSFESENNLKKHFFHTVFSFLASPCQTMQPQKLQ